MNKPDIITVEQAVAALTAAARKDFTSVETQLKAAGFGITRYQPLKAASDIDLSIASDIGAEIEGRGIYHGAWQPRPNGVIVHAYSDTDLLRDASGKQLLLTWYEARDELARRNSGRSYGNGAEPALRQALAMPVGTQGSYQDGDLVMAPQVLLNGVDAGKKTRAGTNTVDLLNAPRSDAFQTISDSVRDSRSGHGRWSWSCSEDRDGTSVVRAVSLSDGGDGWDVRDDGRLGVLPFRVFREPHAVKAVSHLTL